MHKCNFCLHPKIGSRGNVLTVWGRMGGKLDQETKVLVRSRCWLEDGVDFQCSGSFTHNNKLLSFPWERDPWGTRNITFVICPYSFPHHWMSYRISVGSGLFTNLFFIGNKKTWERRGYSNRWEFWVCDGWVCDLFMLVLMMLLNHFLKRENKKDFWWQITFKGDRFLVISSNLVQCSCSKEKWNNELFKHVTSEKWGEVRRERTCVFVKGTDNMVSKTTEERFVIINLLNFNHTYPLFSRFQKVGVDTHKSWPSWLWRHNLSPHPPFSKVISVGFR